MANRQSEAVLNLPAGLSSASGIAGVNDGQLLARFAAHRDELAEVAFTALVRRHGPMVLRVCEQILGERHAAEDAFQVTFLVLAQSRGLDPPAGAPGSLASWGRLAHRTGGEDATASVETARIGQGRGNRRPSDRCDGRPRSAGGLPRGARGLARRGGSSARKVPGTGYPLRAGGNVVPRGGASAALPGGHDRRAAEARAGKAAGAVDSPRRRALGGPSGRALLRRGRTGVRAAGPGRIHSPGRDGLRGQQRRGGGRRFLRCRRGLGGGPLDDGRGPAEGGDHGGINALGRSGRRLDCCESQGACPAGPIRAEDVHSGRGGPARAELWRDAACRRRAASRDAHRHRGGPAPLW